MMFDNSYPFFLTFGEKMSKYKLSGNDRSISAQHQAMLYTVVLSPPSLFETALSTTLFHDAAPGSLNRITLTNFTTLKKCVQVKKTFLT